MMNKSGIQLCSISLVLAILPFLSGSVWASDTSDSMRVGDMQYGNALNPSGWSPWDVPDKRGFSWLHHGMLRSPTGFLYPYAPLREDKPTNKTGWRTRGVIEGGYLHTSGNNQALFFRQYSDWKSGPVISMFGLEFEKPKTGDYVEIRGNRLSENDQFLRVRAGRQGKYKAQAFYRDMPHRVASQAYPFWDGVGSTDLTVPNGTTAGNTPTSQVADTLAKRGRKPVTLTRTRTGLSLEGGIFNNWIGYGSVTNEKRKGTRLWGGPMFFNFAFAGAPFFADTGGALETVRPIDFRTTDINLGMRRVGEKWHFNSVYTGSFFRNHKDHLNYQSPFHLSSPLAPNPTGVDIYQGQFSLEPDNDYHNLRLELSRSLPQNGELSMAAAYGTMRQNDRLRAPVTCNGLMGAGPIVANCADWNSTGALSKSRANARIDTHLLHAKVSFRPTTNFGWHAKVRYYKENNKTRYIAYNPITGEYGYPSENGAQGSVVPGELGIFDPNNPMLASVLTEVRNTPFSYKDTKFNLGSSYRMGRYNRLNADYTFDHYQPENRERKRIDEHRLKLSWNNRHAGNGTLRMVYEYARRVGDKYRTNPYAEFYSESLPGYIQDGIPAPHTVANMRKYDMSNRTENKLRLIYTRPIGDTATLSATVTGLWDHYGAEIGRKSMQSQGGTLNWDWQPSPKTTMGMWASMNTTRIKQSNVDDATGTNTNYYLGGSWYPWENQWWATSRERDYNLGLSLRHNFGRVSADFGYNMVWTYSKMDTRAASASPLAQTGAHAGDGFPDNKYRTNVFDIGVNLAVNQHVGVRMFVQHQRGSFKDWHYLGLQNQPTHSHKIYTDRGPRRHYHATAMGILTNVRF